MRESLSTGSCGAGVSAFRSLVCRQLSVGGVASGDDRRQRCRVAVLALIPDVPRLRAVVGGYVLVAGAARAALARQGRDGASAGAATLRGGAWWNRQAAGASRRVGCGGGARRAPVRLARVRGHSDLPGPSAAPHTRPSASAAAQRLCETATAHTESAGFAERSAQNDGGVSATGHMARASSGAGRAAPLTRRRCARACGTGA